MNKKLLSFALASGFVSNLFAAGLNVTSNQSTISHEDLRSAFLQDNKPLQLASLSKQEMKETEGALLPLAVLAVVGPAAVSAWGYHAASYFRTGSIGTSTGAATAASLGGMSSLGFGTGLGVLSGVTGTLPRLVLGTQGLAVNASLQAANNAINQPQSSEGSGSISYPYIPGPSFDFYNTSSLPSASIGIGTVSVEPIIICGFSGCGRMEDFQHGALCNSTAGC